MKGKRGRTSVDVVADIIPGTSGGAELGPIVEERVDRLYFLVELEKRVDAAGIEHGTEQTRTDALGLFDALSIGTN